MINLLPSDYKSEIRAARTNVIILRYISLMLVGVALVSFLVIATYFSLSISQQSSNARIKENSKREASFASVKKQAEQFRSDLSIAKAITDNEVKYSSLIYRISNALPDGVVLDTLAVDSQTVGTSVTFAASARSLKSAVALKTAFENNTALFENVYLETVTKADGGDYPYKTNLNATIRKEAIE